MGLPFSTRRASIAVCVLLGISSLGCREELPIRSYIVPELPESASDAQSDGPGAGESSLPSTLPPFASPTAPDSPPKGEPTHRMLAAVVKGPDQAWFFKLTAPAKAAESVADGLNEFLDAVRFNENNQPTWKLPDGWTDRGQSGMRHTTLLIPHEDEQLELAVSALPLGSNWKASLLANINRWRGQMQLPPLKATELTDQTRPLDDVSEGSVAVDLLGWSASNSRMPPFAGGASQPKQTGPKQAGPQKAGPKQPGPRQPAASPLRNSPPNKISYDLPKGWVDDSPKPMRAASLRTADAADAAVVTVHAFPATGAMGDPLSNVNRWRGQVGLGPTNQETLDAESEAITIDGIQGRYAELKGQSSSILAAMVTRQEMVWFFKVTGDASSIDDHSTAFREWLATVRFSGGQKAGQTPAEEPDEEPDEEAAPVAEEAPAEDTDESPADQPEE